MKALVTGASGFVGSWLVKRLIEDGWNVRVLCRKNPSEDEFPKGTEISLGDVLDINSIKTALNDIEIVFHLAGVVGYSKKLLGQMTAVNVEGTRNVVEAIKTQKSVRRLIYMSSVTAIGASFDGSPLNENSVYNIKHLQLGYFDTKRLGEEIVKVACDKKEIDAVILNPATIYGPGDAKKGSRKTQIKVAQGKMPFYTSGGVNVVYINDVINAIINSVELGETGERYILGGENITIKKLFEIIALCAGTHPPKIYLPNGVLKTIGWVGDVLENMGLSGPINSENAWTASLFHWFDSGKACQKLSLNITPAAKSISTSVEWMKSNGYLDS